MDHLTLRLAEWFYELLPVTRYKENWNLKWAGNDIMIKAILFDRLNATEGVWNCDPSTLLSRSAGRCRPSTVRRRERKPVTCDHLRLRVTCMYVIMDPNPWASGSEAHGFLTIMSEGEIVGVQSEMKRMFIEGNDLPLVDPDFDSLPSCRANKDSRRRLNVTSSASMIVCIPVAC